MCAAVGKEWATNPAQRTLHRQTLRKDDREPKSDEKAQIRSPTPLEPVPSCRKTPRRVLTQPRPETELAALVMLRCSRQGQLINKPMSYATNSIRKIALKQ
jgi:hypothetical protein